MCGRYTMSTNADALAERFRAQLPTATLPTYNAAPSQGQLTILNAEPHVITVSAWGFVPEWADGRHDVQPLINARAETVATKPFFRDAFKKKRCLVLADGFYEWRRTRDGKVPYRITLKTEEPFAFAGLWSTVRTAAGQPQTTFAIITTESNELVAQIHDRMPVILREEDEENWLNPQLPLAEAQAMLTPYPAERLTAYKVSKKVNAPEYNTPEVLQRV
jgi:putative SOS response-associated peptidase YedK